MPTDPTPLLATDAPAGRRGICAILGDALRIDFSARLDHEVLDSKIRGMPTQHRDARRDVRMASYAHVTEGAVRQMYDDNADPYWTSERADKVVLVLKLGLALSHAGLNSVEVESDMRNCAEALGLPRGTVSVGNRTLTATFGTGAAHTITVVEGFAIHQLNDVHEVAKCIQADLATQVAEDEQQYVLKLAALVDQIMERDSVYSPLIDELADSCFRAASVLAIFDGSVQDVLWVGMLSIVCKLAVRLGALIGIPAGLNAFKHAARVGFIVPLLTFYAEVPYCRLPIIYMALVVCELPGTDLLLGAYELYNGSLVGAARMVHCIVDVAFLGLSLSIGWMIYGVVDDPNRKEAFTLPTKWCEMEPSAWWHSAILYQARGARRTHRLPPIIVDPVARPTARPHALSPTHCAPSLTLTRWLAGSDGRSHSVCATTSTWACDCARSRSASPTSSSPSASRARSWSTCPSSPATSATVSSCSSARPFLASTSTLRACRIRCP